MLVLAIQPHTCSHYVRANIGVVARIPGWLLSLNDCFHREFMSEVVLNSHPTLSHIAFNKSLVIGGRRKIILVETGEGFERNALLFRMTQKLARGMVTWWSAWWITTRTTYHHETSGYLPSKHGLNTATTASENKKSLLPLRSHTNILYNRIDSHEWFHRGNFFLPTSELPFLLLSSGGNYSYFLLPAETQLPLPTEECIPSRPSSFIGKYLYLCPKNNIYWGRVILNQW